MSMSWGSFGRATGSATDTPGISGPTPLQQQRAQQIASLRSFNKNVIEKEWGKEYSIEFSSSGQKFWLFVTLPPQFPNDKPIVRLSPAGKHPWLDERMYVTGCSSLNAFYIHSNLGKVIRQVIEDFKANPPQIVSSSDARISYGEGNFPNYSTMTSTTPTAILISTESVEEKRKKIPKKDLGSCTNLDELMEALKHKSTEDLEQLLNDNTTLLSYIMNMDELKQLQRKRRELLQSNKELAEQNLTFKPKIEELKNDLESKSQKIKSLESELQSRIVHQNEVFQIYDLNQIITNLRIAISQAEEESENIAETFLANKMPVNEFLQSFLEQRKISHQRKAKEERIRYLNPRY